MKTKLTLSIDQRFVAKLRKESERRGKSISAMVEEYADQLEREMSKGKTFSEEFGHWLGLPVEDKWLDEDNRHAKHLRKSAAGEAALAARKKPRA
jgi:hypothetical protein